MLINEKEFKKAYNRLIQDRGYARDNKLHASSSGHCFKKQWYRVRGTEQDSTDEDSLINMRIGSLLHEDIAKSLGMIGKVISSECEIEIPRLNIKGKYDIVELDKRDVWIYDIKSMKAWAWTKKFGIKKNRDNNPSDKYEQQLGTYGLYFQDNGWIVRGLTLVYIKKDNGDIKLVEVPLKYIQIAEEYWTRANKIAKNDKEPIPGDDDGVPFESWECKYCPYASRCGSPYA